MDKVKVKIIKSMAGPGGSSAGDTVEVPRHLAERMVRKREAELVHEADNVRTAIVGNTNAPQAKPSGKKTASSSKKGKGKSGSKKK